MDVLFENHFHKAIKTVNYSTSCSSENLQTVRACNQLLSLCKNVCLVLWFAFSLRFH